MPQSPLDYETRLVNSPVDKCARWLTTVAVCLAVAGVATYVSVWVIAYREGMLPYAFQPMQGNHGAFRHLPGARTLFERSLIINVFLLPLSAIFGALIEKSRRSVVVAVIGAIMFLAQLHLFSLFD